MSEAEASLVGTIVPAGEIVSANKVMPVRDQAERREERMAEGEGVVAQVGS